MARFYGKILGRRNGAVTKIGDAQSGMLGTIAGWRLGAEVVMSDNGGVDHVSIYLTLGSEGTQKKLLFEGTEKQALEFINKS